MPNGHDMDAQSADAPTRKRRNWWKIAFFVALFAFEVAREMAVLASAQKPSIITLASVFTYNGWTVAEGLWTRIDGGEKLIPSLVRIECDQDQGECKEVSVNVYNQSVFAPHLSIYKAAFTPDSITYENTEPSCVRYNTRIDLKLKKTISVRERTANKSKACNHMERRMEMQLGNGWDLTDNSLKEHFVPVLSVLKAIIEATS